MDECRCSSVLRSTAWHSSKVSRKEERWTLLLFLPRSASSLLREDFIGRGVWRRKRLGLLLLFFFFVLFYFFFVHLARCGGRNPPPHLSSSGKNLSFFPLLQICKVSRTWKLNFCFLTTQTADAWGISGAEFKKNKPCCWSLLRRNKKITRY